MGFDFAMLQRCVDLLRRAFARSRRILAAEMTFGYPADIDTADIGNACISDFTARYCRLLREQRHVAVDFLQTSEITPHTGRLHHHVVFLIGGDWWHFVDYRTVRELWRQSLARCLRWTGTASEAPVHVSDNWNGADTPAYGFLADANRPDQVAELFRRMSYLAKNYSKASHVRSFSSSEPR